MSAPTISLCLITGNEEPAVEAFLDSFSGAFDELCLVRAVGNLPHDKTLLLAKAWCIRNGKACVLGEYFNGGESAAPVIGRPVNDEDPTTWPHVSDFAAARNKAWGLATCDWQLWADLDDFLVAGSKEHPGGAELIRLCAGADSHDYFFFKYDLRRQNESNLRERLFRTGISKWVQPIHETVRVEPVDGKEWKALIEDRVVYIHDPKADKQRDPMRNRRIMTWHTRYMKAFAFELHREWYYQWQATRDPVDAENATNWAELAEKTECLPEQRYDLLVNQANIAATTDIDHAMDLCWSAIRINPKNRQAWGDLAEYELRARRAERANTLTGFMQAIPRGPQSGYPQSTLYHGWRGADLRFRALRESGRDKVAETGEAQLFKANGQRISLLHATRGRPKKAIETRNLFFASAFIPLGVEHIFAIDADDAESLAALKGYKHVIVNEPRGCVKAWNAAAAASTGHVLVQLSDDWLPCHDWDILIWEALEKAVNERLGSIPEHLKERGEKWPKATPEEIQSLVGGTPLVLAISDNHRTDSLLCMAILTRARYEQQRYGFWPGGESAGVLGKYQQTEAYLFSPEYFGVYSDNEFTVRAYDDGVVVQAKHILFDHQHPCYTGKPVEQWDETHRRQNTAERYAEGLEIFRRRNPKHARP